MRWILQAVAVILGFATTVSIAASSQNFVGRWEISAKEFGQDSFFIPINEGRLSIAFKDSRYTGTYNQLRFTGDLQKDGLHLNCSDGGAACGELVLNIANDQLTGSGTIIGLPVTVKGRRPADRPYNAPKHYDFEPKEFQSLFSNAIPPVLYIFPGDSVQTKTVDNRGQDEHGDPRSPRGNPQTGPFYVEGAMPGDTLVVHLDRVRTNRNSAFQTNSVWADALESGYLQRMPKAANGSNLWKLDDTSGTASLSQPSDKLKNFVIRMEPMLGCIGVAPPRDQVWGTSYLGVWGGNRDSREVREGSTLYLPVFQPGALLYLGDAHAQQGDGEITGQGLETSMDVRFTVNVIENTSLGQPWIEDKDYIMVMGIGQSLDDALKSATTGMATWLRDNYQLSPTDLAAVMGTALQYEVAEVVDPEFNVVAKIRKGQLAQIRK
jgi:amidase